MKAKRYYYYYFSTFLSSPLLHHVCTETFFWIRPVVFNVCVMLTFLLYKTTQIIFFTKHCAHCRSDCVLDSD